MPGLMIPAGLQLSTATPAMRRAADAFEAQALAQLLAPAFETVDMSRSAFGGGAAEQQWRPMLLDAMAAAAVRGRGGIGLGETVLRAMLQRQAATELGPDGP